jgi:GAF domain-containing protein
VTAWLVEPFSPEFARARVQSWLLRGPCRWVRAPLPPGEAARLAAVRQLGLLDAPPDERFDRITRLAAAALDVPIALVSLVDEDRQWLASCVGVTDRQTPRDVSFCAHAILDRGVMVIPDALLDARFADNPIVTGPPHVRFYAGCPLVLPGGAGVGTLCVIDTRPRQFDEAAVRLLEDLAKLARQEMIAVSEAAAAAASAPSADGTSPAAVVPPTAARKPVPAA